MNTNKETMAEALGINIINARIENNKLIAEFMGKEWHNTFFKDVCIVSPSNISYEFDSNWAWIMLVVEKIESIPSYDRDRFGTSVKIMGRMCQIKSGHYGTKDKVYSKSLYFDCSYGGNTKLEAVYTACVEYVKWFKKPC